MPSASHSSGLFDDEEHELALDDAVEEVPREAWDELVTDLPVLEQPDLLRLLPDEIQIYLAFILPRVQRKEGDWIAPCPFCDCGGELHVHQEYGYWWVEEGCRQQGSVYAFEMRLRGLSFYQSLIRLKSWVARTRPTVHKLLGRKS
jgi:hypothetical protein